MRIIAGDLFFLLILFAHCSEQAAVFERTSLTSCVTPVLPVARSFSSMKLKELSVCVSRGEEVNAEATSLFKKNLFDDAAVLYLQVCQRIRVTTRPA